MEYNLPHDWPNDRGQAIAIQRQLGKQVIVSGNVRQPAIIAAVETAYGREGKELYTAAVAVSFPELRMVERAYDHRPVNFPYIPGLFYFREGPSMVTALAQLESEIDVILVHGHGIAHPDGCGIASCIGLVFGKPSIGCARRLLAGYHRDVDPLKGSSQPIILESHTVGLAYRSRDSVKPIFISPGHLCNIEQARDIIVQCLRGYRLPEPSRIAHAAANKSRRRHERDREPVHH